MLPADVVTDGSLYKVATHVGSALVQCALEDGLHIPITLPVNELNISQPHTAGSSAHAVRRCSSSRVVMTINRCLCRGSSLCPRLCQQPPTVLVDKRSATLCRQKAAAAAATLPSFSEVELNACLTCVQTHHEIQARGWVNLDVCESGAQKLAVLPAARGAGRRDSVKEGEKERKKRGVCFNFLFACEFHIQVCHTNETSQKIKSCIETSSHFLLSGGNIVT